MMFTSIIGHERPVGILKRALANDMLAHAYLFSGDEGVGKKLTALALAAAVNCGEAGGGEACGSCASCRKVASGGHPDVHLLVPDGEEIKIDQIREVQADLALKPFEGVKKTLIVDDADRMNAASANAFLKTLEEPPGDALILLISSMPQSLLPTIRSRCQEVRFLPLSRPALAQAVMERRGLAENDAWFLAALAKGSIGRALDMDVEQEKAAREEVRTLRFALGGMSAAEVVAQAETLSKDRDRFRRMLDIGIEQTRDALVFHETGDEKLLVNSDPREVQRRASAEESVPGMLAEVDLLEESRALLERRVSAQLVAENLLMKLGRG